MATKATTTKETTTATSTVMCPFDLPDKKSFHDVNSTSNRMRLIGRDAQVKILTDTLLQDKVHLLQVYGQPCVGKSKLVWDVLRTIKQEQSDAFFYVKNILVHENVNWFDLESKMINFRNETPSSSRVLIVLKDFHLMSFDVLQSFQEFCCRMSLDDKMSIIIIHQRLLEFDIKGVVSKKLIVPPLDETHAKILFCEYAFNSGSQCRAKNDDEYLDYLVSRCSGLPGLIVSLAHKWTEWSSLASLEEFCDYFRKNDNVFNFMESAICPHMNMKKSFSQLLNYLPENLQKALAELSTFPGPLTLNDITFMIDESSELKTKFEVALPLTFNGFLRKDKDRFQMQPLIRDMANRHLYHMYDADVNRLKFVQLIGNVLLKAEEIYRNNMPLQTVGIVKDNWDNIDFLLRQGINLKSDGNEITVLFQVAVEAGDVISACCPREAKEFFRDCLNASENYGTTEQKAMMQVRYGQSLTNEGGAGGEKGGMTHYQEALAALKEEGKDYRTLCLLNSMAYNYYRQGELKNACKCAHEALEMEVRDVDPEEANHVKVNSASIYAYTLIYLGHHKKAKQVIHDALENIGDSDHASIAVMLNSLGLAEEGPNGSEIDALKWYSRSLSRRRQMSVIKPENLVIPLCHIADLASKKPQKYELAMKYLNEARDIMKKKCWIHIHSATIQYTFGVVKLRMNYIDDALLYFEDALNIHQQLHSNHYFNAMLLNWIAHCYLLKDDVAQAARKFEDTRIMMADLIEMRPNACYLAQPLEHLVRMNHHDKLLLVSYQDQLINELQRLVNFIGLDKSLLSIYEDTLKVYEDCKNKNKKFLEEIPMTCTVCKEVKESKICPLSEYKEKVNSVSYTKPRIESSSSQKKKYRPRPVEFFTKVPRPPDPCSISPPKYHNFCSNNDYNFSLEDEDFSCDSSKYKKSSLTFSTNKDCDSKQSLTEISDDNSLLINETKVITKTFLKRGPLPLVEHSEERSLFLNGNPRMSESYGSGKTFTDEVGEGSKRETIGITDMIFVDQSRQYKSFSLQNNLNSNQGNLCPLNSPDEKQYLDSSECVVKMKNSSGDAHLKANIPKLENNLSSRLMSSNVKQFQNAEMKKNIHSKQMDIFFDANDVKTPQNRECDRNMNLMMEGTRNPKFSMPHRGTDSNLKEKKKDADQHSTKELFLAHQNDIRLTETFEQNSVPPPLNLPNFKILLPGGLERLEKHKTNFVNEQNETS